jgi:hypothetical protein
VLLPVRGGHDLGQRRSVPALEHGDQARPFASMSEAFNYYDASAGLRLDGERNRPLTAYTAEIELWACSDGIEPVN